MSVPGSAWGEIARLCKTLHQLIYDECDIDKALERLPELEQLLSESPQDDTAILSAEARALYHELREEFELAADYRSREIVLMEMLYEDIRANDYDSETERYLLRDRGVDEYKVRKDILQSLKNRAR